MRQSCRIEVWCSEQVATVIKELAEAQLTTESHIGRQAFQFFLQSLGALPRPNGRRETIQEELSNGPG